MELTLENALRVYQWCVNKFGTDSANYKGKPPAIVFRPYGLTETGTIAYKTSGVYERDRNQIWVFFAIIKKQHPDTALYEGIKTIIHEYIHYLQDLSNYNLLSEFFGYWNNPREVEARTIADLYAPKCWQELFPTE